MTEHLKFTLTTRLANRKTDIWIVRSAHTGSSLGRVSWFSGWRKYVFDADPQTFFDANCLRDIAAFCESETEKHKGES